MTTYRSPVDIGNRALQMLGATRMTALTDDSKNAAAVLECYDKLRVSELRRNVWRFAVRLACLRSVSEYTMQVGFATYDATKNYPRGAVVVYGDYIYQAFQPAGVGVNPTNTLIWEQYFGNATAEPYDDTDSYQAGEIVYTPSTSAYKVYLSLENGNEDDPTDTPDWDATVTYRKGEVVLDGATPYQSKIDLNINADPSASPTAWETIPATQPQRRYGRKWIEIGATLTSLEIAWPLGSGPRESVGTRNVYMLPFGFLREAPLTPRKGSYSGLGAPSGYAYSDRDLTALSFVSAEAGPVMFRFVADIAAVFTFDPMFCSGLASRIALEICEEITQSDGKLANLGAQYQKFMSEARTVNGIETGPSEPPEDDYITCRA